jgi:hypothetical protein
MISKERKRLMKNRYCEKRKRAVITAGGTSGLSMVKGGEKRL